MQRLAAISISMCALVGCFGNPAILGVGEDGDGDGNGEGGSGGSGNDGFSDTGGPDDDGAADTAGESGPAPSCAEIDAFGQTYAATLTPSQYDATVRDLTGAAGPFAPPHTDLQKVGPFGLGMELEMAAGVAPDVAAAVDLTALLPCDPATTDPTEQQQCFDAFAPGLARLAWRRAVVPADLDAQVAAFAGAGDFATRMRAVIASIFADPEFIVLARTGTATGGDEALVVLDAHALATRLAMFLWNSGPDATLLDLADSGELLDPEILHAQAQRLLDDVRAARMVDDFTAHWIAVHDVEFAEKDPVLFPQYDAALAADMLRATQAFARSVWLDGSGRLEDLFMSPTSFANADLAMIYGVDIVGDVPSNSALEPVSLDPAHRGGLLTEPSFLTNHSLPDQIGCTQRGKVIRANLLCQETPPPPTDVDQDPFPPGDGTSSKETCVQHVADPACAACHALTDPFTFAFDNYDPIGRWLDAPVDPSGEAPDGFVFENRIDLTEQLLASEPFNHCTVIQFVRYALDRHLSDEDACTLDELEQALADSDGNVRTLALAIVDSDAFRVARVP